MSDRADAKHDNDGRWATLMQAAQNGDGKAYAQLLSELLPIMRRVVAHKWPRELDAEDIVQEILASVHAVRRTYDPSRPFMPWLMTIAMRRMADAARQKYSRSVRETTVDIMPETFSRDDTKFEQDISDERQALRKALSALPEGQRQAIELLKIQGLSLEEASRATGKTIASLKVSVHRAIKTMRQVLERKS